MKDNLLFNFLKYELLFLSRSERTKGFMVYIIGLPLVSYLLAIFSTATDSSFGISLLSICGLNIFYAPLQFYFDRKYSECIFSKNTNSYKMYVVAKMLFLQLCNFMMYILILPLNLIFYDINAFIFTTTFLVYCVGFASPLIVLLSGLRINSNFFKGPFYNKITITHILTGILPFLIIISLLIIFNSTITIVYIVNLILGIIGLILNPIVIKIVKKRIVENKYLL